jgi:hypothetical protein
VPGNQVSSASRVRREAQLTGLLPLFDSWPVFERARQFNLGFVVNSPVARLPELPVLDLLGRHSAGWWECDLADNALTWTSGVYGIFGIPQGSNITRGEALSLYSEQSRAILERVRGHSIRSRRGFLLDAEIRPASGKAQRWMRLIGVPVCEGGDAVRLHGLKLLI